MSGTPTMESTEHKHLANRGHKARRQALFRTVQTKLASEFSEEELDIHFTHMPPRYWPRATAASVCRHLGIIRQFFTRLQNTHTDGTTPVITWRQLPNRNLTEVTICTWDRLGLLAKVAGAFAQVDLNILRADVYTRVDHVALDVFEVCDSTGKYVKDEARLALMAALLSAALQPDAPPSPVHLARHRRSQARTNVYFEPAPEDSHNVLVVEAPDQIGLLYRIFTALAGCEVNVSQAIITTEAGRAGDVFYITDGEHRRITDPLRLEKMRESLLAIL